MAGTAVKDGFLFSTVQRLRGEAKRLRGQFGAEASAVSLETAASWIESDIHAFLGLGFSRDVAAHLTDYSARQIDRLIKAGAIEVRESGELPLLSLPVKPGGLAKLLSTAVPPRPHGS